MWWNQIVTHEKEQQWVGKIVCEPVLKFSHTKGILTTFPNLTSVQYAIYIRLDI